MKEPITLTNSQARTLRLALDELSSIVDSWNLSQDSYYARHRERIIRDIAALRKLQCLITGRT